MIQIPYKFLATASLLLVTGPVVPAVADSFAVGQPMEATMKSLLESALPLNEPLIPEPIPVLAAAPDPVPSTTVESPAGPRYPRKPYTGEYQKAKFKNWENCIFMSPYSSRRTEVCVGTALTVGGGTLNLHFASAVLANGRVEHGLTFEADEQFQSASRFPFSSIGVRGKDLWKVTGTCFVRPNVAECISADGEVRAKAWSGETNKNW